MDLRAAQELARRIHDAKTGDRSLSIVDFVDQATNLADFVLRLRSEPPETVVYADLSEALVRDSQAIDRIAALLAAGTDLDGSDACEGVADIVRSTGRRLGA